MLKTIPVLLTLVSISVASQFPYQDSLQAWLKTNPPFDFVLIDVRGPQDNITSVIGNSRCKPYNLVWDQQFKQIAPVLDKNQHIVITCRSGSRAGSAVSYLKTLGYNNVYNAGGFSTWTDTSLMLPVADTLSSSLLPQPSMKAIPNSVQVAGIVHHNSQTQFISFISFYNSNINFKPQTGFFTISGQAASPSTKQKRAGVSQMLIKHESH